MRSKKILKVLLCFAVALLAALIAVGIYLISLWNRVEHVETDDSTEDIGELIRRDEEESRAKESSQAEASRLAEESEREASREEQDSREEAERQLESMREESIAEESRAAESRAEESRAQESSIAESITDASLAEEMIEKWGFVLPDNLDLPPLEYYDENARADAEKYYTFVLFGVDARNNTTLLKGTQGDVVILISIDKKTYEVRMLSIYRDTCIFAGGSAYKKITDLYRAVGAVNLCRILEDDLDIKIDGFVTVNWKASADAVNRMGGLDVVLSERECDALNGEVAGIIEVTGIESTMIEKYEGSHTLDGVQAVAYCRIRKVGNADYQRTERQRTILTLAMNKLQTLPLSEIMGIAEMLLDETATSIDFGTVLSLVNELKKFEIVDLSGFPFRFNTNNQIYMLGVSRNVEELHRFLYGTEQYTPSGYVARLNYLYTQLNN